MAASGEVVGRYFGADGVLGIEITRWFDSDGRQCFTYTGRWGSGSSASAEIIRTKIAAAIAYKRGVVVDVDFGDRFSEAPRRQAVA